MVTATIKSVERTMDGHIQARVRFEDKDAGLDFQRDYDVSSKDDLHRRIAEHCQEIDNASAIIADCAKDVGTVYAVTVDGLKAASLISDVGIMEPVK